MDSQQKRNIVIIGGGIIGCTTAYYLTRHSNFNPALHQITLLEATGIAANASGKAGGLLGLWAYPACLVPLSYRLHSELAQEHGGSERWGYRRVKCGSLSAVVRDEDVRKAAARKVARGHADAGTAEARPNGPANVGNGGQGSPADLPIQGISGGPREKAWEKLPKQDDNAATLLTDSLVPADLDWIDGALVEYYQEMGKPGTTDTAQVHPYYFTTAMAELARDKGVDIRLRAKATQINHSKAGVQSIEYEDRDTGSTNTIDGVTDVVVTAGPWTGKLFPRSRIEGIRAHSVVFDVDVSPYAVFTEINLPPGYVPEHRALKGQKRNHKGNVDPEIYARPGSEVYVCGEPDIALPLPDTADLVQVDEAQCDDITAYVSTISPQLAAAPVKTKQACYLPRQMRFGQERGPIIGATSVPGLYVASGHTCWGIQNGPATGLLMAELLLDGKATSADISELDPRKFKV
ncbi:hypothetical protein VTK73DRAFT_7390 [Phialemonium thermophilum]|uniref:FAD dependent oxidoreductase domain-containing protein n=1 Tax=Phialemonium thermophilum TaxID=223376 RepID=A0ABR3XU14_9PEZI